MRQICPNMSLKGLLCQVSKSTNRDTCPRPTTHRHARDDDLALADAALRRHAVVRRHEAAVLEDVDRVDVLRAGRGRVSLLADLDAWHSNTFRGKGHPRMHSTVPRAAARSTPGAAAREPGWRGAAGSAHHAVDRGAVVRQHGRQRPADDLAAVDDLSCSPGRHCHCGSKRQQRQQDYCVNPQGRTVNGSQ
jgi:hypothetical protein